MRTICVITGTRADYGLLQCLMKEIQKDPGFQLQLIVTGMHLSPEFGLTYKVIEQDGFHIDAKVEMLLSSDTPVGIAKSIGLGVIGFAEALERMKPDIIVILGDRFEMLAAAQAAMVATIPIAHIAGGDTTEGAFDEAIRHSITKMAHLHFVTNELSKRRVLQMGENQLYVFNVGSPGIDQIRQLALLTRPQLEKILDFRFLKCNLLVTFHPVTLDEQPAMQQLAELLKALDLLGPNVGIIITKPNADPQGRVLIQMIDDFTKNRSNVRDYTSMGQLRYLSSIAHVDAVVGNSSSGLYEVPSFKKPTVNIGDRQKGRVQAASVINCLPKCKDIYEAIQNAFNLDCSKVINPYGTGESSIRILKILTDILDYKALLKKSFHEVSL